MTAPVPSTAPELRPKAEIIIKGRVAIDIHYLFDIIESNQIEAEADITDHYVEDNSACQDHMALKPIRYTLSGFVAEKVFNRRLDIKKQVEDSTQKIGGWESITKPLGAFSGICPTISNYANVAVGTYNYVEASIKRYTKNFTDIKNLFNKNKVSPLDAAQYEPSAEIIPIKQASAFINLNTIRNARALVSLKTPFGDFTNTDFLIESVSMEQGDTASMSRLVVTLKQYRSVETKTVKVDAEKYAGRVAANKAITENLGKVKGKEDDGTTTLYRIFYT